MASTTTHKTQIYLNGKLAYQWPISTGRASLPTPDGTYLSVEKANPVRMVGGGPREPGHYNELVNYAVRFTYSGDYYHSAPWSVGEPGHHERQPRVREPAAAAAQTYYNMAIPGDPMTVIASTAAGKWDDGLTDLVQVLDAVLKGSATGAGRAGRAAGQHVRRPVVAARLHRLGPARHLRVRQLLRRLG